MCWPSAVRLAGSEGAAGRRSTVVWRNGRVVKDELFRTRGADDDATGRADPVWETRRESLAQVAERDRHRLAPTDHSIAAEPMRGASKPGPTPLTILDLHALSDLLEPVWAGDAEMRLLLTNTIVGAFFVSLSMLAIWKPNCHFDW